MRFAILLSSTRVSSVPEGKENGEWYGLPFEAYKRSAILKRLP